MNVFLSCPPLDEIHLRTYVNLKSIDMGSDFNFGSVDVDIMKTSCVINLIFVITFLGNGDSDVMGVLSFNFVITTAAITVMVTLALPL